MRLKLLKDRGNLKAGAEWTCPWATVGRQLIEAGAALAVEVADLHLNPKGEAIEAPPAAPPAGSPTVAPQPVKPSPAKRRRG